MMPPIPGRDAILQRAPTIQRQQPANEAGGVLQRVGGLLSRGLQSYGGLFAGDADPNATDEQNRRARQQALLASAAALAGQQGFDAIPRAMLAGREVADQSRESARERAEEQERRQRVEGLLGGGVENPEAIRGLLGEAIRSGDTGLANLARGMLSDLEQPPLSAIRAGRDTVLIDPRTGEERGRFEGDVEVASENLGTHIRHYDANNPSRTLHTERITQRTTPSQQASAEESRRREMVGQAMNYAGLLAQHGAWDAGNVPPITALSQLIRSRFPDLDPTEAAAVARESLNQHEQWSAQQAGRQLTNEQREQRVGGGEGEVDLTNVQNVIQRARDRGLSDAEILENVPAVHRAAFERVLGAGAAPAPAAAPAGGQFGAFSDLVPSQ